MKHHQGHPVMRMQILLGFLAIVILAGCGNAKKESEQAASDQQDADSVRAGVLTTLSSHSITRQLHANGLDFQTEVLNDIRQVPHYTEISNKGAAAANLGVYMSDLGYLTDFKKQEESRRCFEGCVVLANHIGMGEQFSHAIELRFSEIISGNEELKTSLDLLFRNVNDKASGDEFRRMHAAALAGYYVEELYHMVRIVQPTQPNNSTPEVKLQALQALISQRVGVGNLVSYFDHLDLKPEGIVVYQEFLKLQSNYLALDAKKLEKETDPAVILADKNFQELAASIIATRNSITGL